MSFDCMNINSSFLEMLGFTNSSEMMTGNTGFSKGDALFEDQFANLLQGNQFKTDGSKSENNILDQLVSFVTKELNGLQGGDFLKKLKEFFMMISGNNLKNLSISEQGLDVLKELLVGAGFGIDQINELIDDLKLTMSDTGEKLSVDELMDKISGFDWENSGSDDIKNQEPEQEAMLPMSALPFIESIMIALGMPEDVRNSILSDVKTDQGIDLNILIKNFKEFEKKSFASQKFFKADSNHNNVVKLLDQLNLGDTSKSFTDGKLSLQEFINILENKRTAVLEVSTDTNSKENLFVSPVKILKSKAEQSSPLTISNFSSVNTGEENKISDLVDNLFKNISKKEVTNDKIVNVPLDKFNNKDFEKLFPISIKAENPKDFQTAIKSELEEKFTKLLGKLSTDMSGKNDSESKNPFQEGKKQASVLKMPDSTNSVSGEGKLLNGARYLSSAKKGQASTLPSYVTNQIGRSIVRAVNQGQNEVRIQLKPPELGRMMITIEELGNGVKVSIVAENQTARDMLLSNSNNLKAALEGSGISLENFDVEMGSDFNQSMRDAKNQAGYSKNKKDQNNEAVDGKNIKVGREALLQEKHLTHDGVLYYVA